MVKNVASKRSSIPPCPGMMLPESFTPKLRLNNDSSKSPYIAAGTMKNTATVQNNCRSESNNALIENAIKTVKIIPPIVPSQVFLGEIRLNNFVFPKNFPERNAKVSFVQIRINIPASSGNEFESEMCSAIAKTSGIQMYMNPYMETPILINGFSFLRHNSVQFHINNNGKTNVNPIENQFQYVKMMMMLINSEKKVFSCQLIFTSFVC